MQVILKHLRTGYLWEKVRVQGGAYGCMCSFDRGSGDFVFASYRDPNIGNTLKAYDACAGYILKHTPGRRALEAAIIGAIGEIDAYMLPEARGETAFLRKFSEYTPEMRARMREEALSTTAADFKCFAETLAGAMPQGVSVAIGGNALEEMAKKEGWSISRVF